MNNWNQKVCKQCRALWEKGDRPTFISESVKYHSRLYKCNNCNTYWEEYERYADVVDFKNILYKYDINLKE